MHGESTTRCDTITFSTLSPSASLTILQSSSYDLASSHAFFGPLELETLLRHAHERVAVKVLELRDGVLVNRVDEVQDLEAFLLETSGARSL